MILPNFVVNCPDREAVESVETVYCLTNVSTQLGGTSGTMVDSRFGMALWSEPLNSQDGPALAGSLDPLTGAPRGDRQPAPSAGCLFGSPYRSAQNLDDHIHNVQ